MSKGKKDYKSHLHFIVNDSGVSSYLQDASGNKAVLESGNVNPLCYMDEEMGFTVSKRSGCNTQGGKNKYCGLYKSPLELVVDIEQKYGEIVRRYVDPAKMDPGIIYALIAQESRGEPNADSGTGAAGLMQFTKDTGFRYGLCDDKKCTGRDDRTNPEKSIAAGVTYYGRLQEEFKDYAEGDIFAIAAYNAGSELIKRAIEKTEWSDPTWDQVAVMITQDLVGDVYGTKHGMGNISVREKKALEIKDHVSNVRGYYSFYIPIRDSRDRRQIADDRETDTVGIKGQ
ncbi:lytic transglycosylase domain-containing protein [Candidatus Woesearchaeota archaeon]|nr:lytic transglycosylase domain-containing protein [Candidatus Woesearchaeota archaeon]